MFMEASIIYVFISSNSESYMSKIILLYDYPIFILLEVLEKVERNFHISFIFTNLLNIFFIMHILMP